MSDDIDELLRKNALEKIGVIGNSQKTSEDCTFSENLLRKKLTITKQLKKLPGMINLLGLLID